MSVVMVWKEVRLKVLNRGKATCTFSGLLPTGLCPPELQSGQGCCAPLINPCPLLLHRASKRV